jgi:ferredoxin-NADP reductase
MSEPGRSAARDYYQVPVAAVIRETGDAASLALDVPPALAGTFAYRPGQFVTVRVPSEQTGSVARCYSLCSSPQAGERPAITVKRTAGGYASNWLLDHVAAGTVLDLLPPAGTFCPRSLGGDFLLFAAGSGITPIISILKSVLAAGRGRVALVYANRDDQSVIFAQELRRLAVAATLTVELDGATRVLPWPGGSRMLDVLIAAGLTAPHSCRQGICGACACRLVNGEVEMAHNEVLEPADLADGYILACQAVPVTADVSITY